MSDKDAIGTTKLPLGLVPDTITAEVALAFLEGALKYGRYNWRIAGVRASVYNDALERHRKKWWNGESADPKTRVKHLASVIACAGILLDAELCGMLTDDRAPYAPLGDLMDSPEMLERIAHLKALFKDHSPKQYTIADKPAPGESGPVMREGAYYLRRDGEIVGPAMEEPPAPGRPRQWTVGDWYYDADMSLSGEWPADDSRQLIRQAPKP